MHRARSSAKSWADMPGQRTRALERRPMTPESTPWLFEGWRFSIFFVVLWVTMCGVLAFTSGWFGLSKRLAGRLPVTSGSSSFQSGAMGNRYFPVSYGNCLFVKVGPAGIGISILWLFRVFAPPIVIPWQLVQSVEPRPWWRFGGVTITLRGHWARLTLRGRAGRLVREMYAHVQEQPAL